jgi:rhodanese-related sulfurtransferase
VTANVGIRDAGVEEHRMFRKTFEGLCLVLVSSVALAGEATVAPLSQEAFLALPKQGADAPFVLDVRTPEEFASGYVPGAVNIPHDQLAARLAEVPKDREVVLYCRSGRRVGLAGEVLAEHGYRRLVHLEGDIGAWVERGRPVAKPKDPAACVAALRSGKATAPACVAN